MKTILIFMLSFFSTVALLASEKENTSYVKTGDQVYFGYKVHQGLFKTSIKDSDGKVIRIPKCKVESMMYDGRLFERKPVVQKNGESAKCVLMEYIGSRNGLSLYRCTCCNRHEGPAICSKTAPDTQYVYFVYRQNQLHLKVDASNAVSVLPFFGIDVQS